VAHPLSVVITVLDGEHLRDQARGRGCQILCVRDRSI
jgi:hypothetical protein